MDIRTKLVFALVAVALGSMFVLGWVMSSRAEVALRESRLEELEGLAEAKKEGLEQVFQGWVDRVTLVASRLPLKENLQAFNEGRTAEAGGGIQVILEEAVRGVDVIAGLAVYDPQRRLVAQTGRGVNGDAPVEASTFTRPVAPGVFYQGVTGNGENATLVRFVANLTTRQGILLGNLHISFDARDLLELAGKGVGLGESGETLVVDLDEDGHPRILNRSGSSGNRIWARMEGDSGADPVQMALAGEEGVHWQGVTDDRGNRVWAAVRFLPEPGWGLVLKVDAREARAPMGAFREQAARLTLSLGAFAIVLGILLGFQFSKPILKLVETTDELRNGNFRARAPVTGEDELSLLAQTFNEMAEELEGQITELAEYHYYFQVSRDMLCIAGPDGYFKRVNPAFEKTLGWDQEEILSRPFLDFVHPEDQDETLKQMESLARGIPTVSFENRYEMAQGGHRILQWTAHPDPNTNLIYAIAQDVTEERAERNRAKEEINRLRSRLDAVMKENPDGEGDPS